MYIAQIKIAKIIYFPQTLCDLLKIFVSKLVIREIFVYIVLTNIYRNSKKRKVKKMEKENGEVIYLVEHISQRTEASKECKILLWAYKDKAAAYDTAKRLGSAKILENDYKSEFRVEETCIYPDKKDITEIKFTMRDFIKEHLDEILDKFFQKNVFCCICTHAERCEENAKLKPCDENYLIPCEVNANIPKENGLKFLDSQATSENIAKIKEIYEEIVTR